MASQNYYWQRFWVRREATINLSDGGYLLEPMITRYGTNLNPDAVPFAAIASIPCLALLAEPGMGKSRTLQLEQTAIDKAVSEQGDQTQWLDLRSYGSEDRLIRALFEDPRFKVWVEGSHRLYLFLDSLDEGLLRVDTLATLLVDELRKYPVERLALRIACRTAEWPNVLEVGLQQLWGEETVRVYELAPLRREDVAEAARSNNVDPVAFMREVERMKAVPLAIKPVTLELLLAMYHRKGHFPSTQAELYRDGCRLLCDETSDSRRAARRNSVLSAQQRMLIAGRIAAITVFANRSAIWTGVDRGDVPDEDVTIQELLIEDEVDGASSFTETAIRETLDTGLFSSRGPKRMGWAHQTYAEFLAAWYLTQQDLTIEQILSLLVHGEDPAGKLVPQMHEVAAWLAGMVPEVFRTIMRTDPEVLLRSDVATADMRDRKALVASLLQLFDEEKLLDRDRTMYGKLAHPELAEQLRPYIVDSTKGWLVRRVAIDIAEACELRILQDDLVSLALDQTQPTNVRVNAAYAVGRMGDDATKAKLKPLAIVSAGDDPDDELRGCGLLATWPQHITIEEVLAVLDAPRNGSLFGSYDKFIAFDFPEHLQPAHLPVALDWVAKQPSRHKLSYMFGKLLDAILLQGWEQLDAPEVLTAFAQAALSRLKYHESIIVKEMDDSHSDVTFNEMLREDDRKRRRLVNAVLPLLQASDKELLWITFSGTPLIRNKDVPWLLERLESSVSEETQLKLSRLIERAFDQNDAEQFELVFRACQNNSVLADSFSWRFNPIRLDSLEAHQLKADYYEQLTWHQRREDRPLLEPPPSERVERCLARFELGDLAAWWHLNMELSLEPHSSGYGSERESDLTRFPGWEAADDTTRGRIVQAAKHYVLEANPEPDKWLGTGNIHRPDFAGYRALRLLLQESPAFIATLSAHIWQRWAAVILAFPTSSEGNGRLVQETLVTEAYRFAPAAVIESLILLIDAQNKELDFISVIDRVARCWDKRLADALLAKARDSTLNPHCTGSLLAALLDHQVAEAQSLAESFVAVPLPKRGKRRSRAIIAARTLFTHAHNAGWTVVWPALQQDSHFGREVVELVAHSADDHNNAVVTRLNEDQLADLFIWVTQHYPHAEDPKPVGFHFHTVEPRESIVHWKENVLQHLRGRGTYQACAAIQRIARELPDLEWLKWTLLDAQALTRRRSWAAPTPGDVLLLTRDQDARLVQSEEQLLAVVIESLRRLEAHLQGETPAAIDLWNELSKGVYTPRDENRLSDYLKRYLEQDLKRRGVVVNREVEIRRGEGTSTGERTDIRVEAVTRDQSGTAYSPVVVIIEVKGSWHRELMQAMETQLVERYLHDNRCRHGLYLVGWFNCQQWKDEHRRRQAMKLGMDKARLQKQLDLQASDLSKHGVHIQALVINAALR